MNDNKSQFSGNITKTEKSWNKIFNKYDVLDAIEKNGAFEITADKIREEREPRLMVKFDCANSRPGIFRRHNLSILPVTRGSYLIAPMKNYEKLDYSAVLKPKNMSMPSYIQSLDPKNVYSEAAALSCAFVSGMINEIAEDNALPTISGRMATGQFSFNIQSENSEQPREITVNNSQCEIDAGFETKDKLLIVEAKNIKLDDFIIRQLYYPYRLWQRKCSKQVVPVFMSYSNDHFSFFIYEFADKEYYNSLNLVATGSYIINAESITFEDIADAFRNTYIKPDDVGVPFPQANDFNRIVDLLGLLLQDDLTKDEITHNYGFTSRQADYYANSAIYLGLAEKKSPGCFAITKLGEEIMRLEHRSKMLALVKHILQHEVFNKAFKLVINNNFIAPTTNQINEIMQNTSALSLTENTQKRRSSTVLGWINWILNLASEKND